MSQQRECPRCRQPATATASRRGRCTACGASLVTVNTASETNVRDYLYGRHALTPTGRETEPSRSSGR